MKKLLIRLLDIRKALDFTQGYTHLENRDNYVVRSYQVRYLGRWLEA